MRNKVVDDVATALVGVRDGDTVLVGGFGLAGQPIALIHGLLASGVRQLTVVANNAGNGDTGLAALLAAGRVAKVVCSFPRQSDSWVFDRLYRAGDIELEVVPQGNLAERIRAGGAGIGAFFSPTGYGTPLAEGKETRTIKGRDTSSSIRSPPTWPWSLPIAATASGTSCSAARRATSTR